MKQADIDRICGLFDIAQGNHYKALDFQTRRLESVLGEIADAIKAQNALLAQATHPNRCPCEACRGKQ